MAARISKRKEKLQLACALSTAKLLDELKNVRPKFKAKIRKELAKRGVMVNGKTNEVIA